MHIELTEQWLTVSNLAKLASIPRTEITVSEQLLGNCKKSHLRLLELIEENLPIYGVTTGYGDSCHRLVGAEHAETLQENLVNYLQCGTGPLLSRFAAKAMCVARLRSLSLGYSGVSPALIEHMAAVINADIVPAVPSEGSLGASGDLIPLAYFAAVLQGNGHVLGPDGTKQAAATALQAAGLQPYKLKAKEGLALVNGTSAMVGVGAENLNDARFLADITLIGTAWLCMALEGRTDAFGSLVNEQAKRHAGQSQAALAIKRLLTDEAYQGRSLHELARKGSETAGFVQDRYSLRCTPQIMGPVFDTLTQVDQWLETEINSVADNPVIDPATGDIAMGGNFYGGHLGHGQDYLKICLGSMADLIDRQLMTLIDDKSNRGLPPNLANWQAMPEHERHLHHGLKALHQAVNAITAEVLNLATPHTIFSRSSELHNQDKVSMGMGSATSCRQMIDKSYSIVTLNLICLAQALDLRDIKLAGDTSRELYETVRGIVPFVSHDQPLSEQVATLKERLKTMADQQKEWLTHEGI